MSTALEFAKNFGIVLGILAWGGSAITCITVGTIASKWWLIGVGIFIFACGYAAELTYLDAFFGGR